MSTKQAYEQKLQAQLDEWNAEIDKLAAQARQLDADARIGFDEELDGLKAQRDQVERKLAQLRGAGDAAWEDLKIGIDTARETLAEAVASARSRFR